jgi:hypothetical protein
MISRVRVSCLAVHALALAALATPGAARAQGPAVAQAAEVQPAEAQPAEAQPAEAQPAQLATAAPRRSDFGAELRGYMGFGGEELASVQYSDGSNSDLSTGTYFFLGVGGIYSPWRSGNMGIDLELLAGWASWSTGPENTEDRIQLSRFPLEALAYYRHTLSDVKDHEMLIRVGGGVSYHLIGGISGSGSLEDIELDLDNALGGVGEAAFIWTALAAGVRYSPMTYRVSETGEKLGATSVGVFLSLLLEPGLF